MTLRLIRVCWSYATLLSIQPKAQLFKNWPMKILNRLVFDFFFFDEIMWVVFASTSGPVSTKSISLTIFSNQLSHFILYIFFKLLFDKNRTPSYEILQRINTASSFFSMIALRNSVIVIALRKSVTAIRKLHWSLRRKEVHIFYVISLVNFPSYLEYFMYVLCSDLI